MNGLVGSGPRYVVAGALFAFLNALMLIGFDSLDLHYGLALLASVFTLVPLSYWIHLRFTYGVESSIDRFLRYCGTQIVSMPLSLVMIFLIHEIGGIAMAWTAWIVLGLMFLYNFLGSHWAIRSRRNLEGSVS